jgi:hypothetical protein
MKSLLQKFIGQEIGINCKALDEFHVATLVSLYDNYFTVQMPEVTFHYPYSQLIFVSEKANGFKAKVGWASDKKVNVIVQIYTLTAGGGGGGVGFGIIF